MAKFNQTNKGIVSNPEPDMVNIAGGVSYSRGDYKKEVASVVLASMLKGDSYYQSEKSRLSEVESLIKKGVNTDAEFLAKCMIFTRNEGKLRSISHVMAANLAKEVKGSNFLRKALVKSFRRVDDMTETASYFFANKGDKLPNVLRRAFKDSLEKSFDEYQFKKYLGEKNSVKLRDIVKLAHPSPTSFEDKDIFKKIIEGTLPNIETAQTVNAATTGDTRKETYINMIKDKKLGYMALIKNLKNIAENNLNTEELNIVVNAIKNDYAIKKSMLLPFRFYDAYKEISSNSNINKMQSKKIASALEYAFGVATMNTGIIEEGETIGILHDCSGSMGSGQNSPFHRGMIIAGAMLQGLPKGNSIVYLWSNRAEEVSFGGSAFHFIDNTRTYGGGTDLGSAFKKLIADKTVLDKIVITTDMGINYLGTQQMFKEYRKISPNVKILFWNLEGYTNNGTPIKLNDNVLEISGYSDKLFDIIPLIWKDENALIKKIEAIELQSKFNNNHDIIFISKINRRKNESF